MLPGFPKPVLKKPGVAYATAVAAITNKTVYNRADTSSAANGNSLTTVPWVNEALSVNWTGAVPLWNTGVQNGLRGVNLSANGVITTTTNLNTVFGGTVDATFFAVEKRDGTQGAGGQPVSNSTIIDDASQRFGLGFLTNTRQFGLDMFNGSAYTTFSIGASFTDSVAYVLAVQISSSGTIRVNFNGTIVSTTSGPFSGYFDVATAVVRPLHIQNNPTTPQYALEYIASSVRQSDIDTDNLVQALKTKWAIT